MPFSLLLSPTSLSTGIQAVGLALRLLFVMVLASRAGPAILGYFSLLIAIELIAIYAAGFELHTFTTRRYSRNATPRKLRICLATHTWILRYSAALAVCIGTGAAWLFDVNLDAMGYVCFGLVTASGTVTQEIGRYLVLTGKPIRAMMVSFMRSAGWMPVAVFVIDPAQDPIRNILIAWAVASLLAMSWGLYAVHDALSRKLRIRSRYVMRALYLSANYYAGSTMAIVQSNIERFVLQMMLGPAAAGIYSLFQMLANTLSAFIQAGVLNIYLPQLLTAFGRLTSNRRTVLADARRRALIFCLAVSAMILAASVPIMYLIGHTDYLPYWWILPLLLAGQSILMWTQPVHLALYGAHRDRLLLIITGASLLASLGISSALVALAGVAGAAFAPVLVNFAVARARCEAFRRLTARGEA